MAEEKKNVMNESEDNSGIKMVIMRILSDDDFKQELLADPDKALEGYNLTEVQRILIKTLGPDDLEKITPDNVNEFFSADAAVYTPDEGASPDEFETLSDDDEDDKLE
jgi:hypothetical protein